MNSYGANKMTVTSKSIFSKLGALIIVAVLLAISTVTTISKNAIPVQVIAWFEALQTHDKGKVSQLLSNDAVIELKDLGITQTKAEFVDSLDQWAELNKGATILTRFVSSTENTTEIEVCYRFANNEVLTRETYAITNLMISKSVQEEIGKSCPAF